MQRGSDSSATTSLTVDPCSVEAFRRGKPKIVPVSTCSIDIDNDRANVADISELISREAFGGQAVVLMNSHKKTYATLTQPQRGVN